MNLQGMESFTVDVSMDNPDFLPPEGEFTPEESEALRQAREDRDTALFLARQAGQFARLNGDLFDSNPLASAGDERVVRAWQDGWIEQDFNMGPRSASVEPDGGDTEYRSESPVKSDLPAFLRPDTWSKGFPGAIPPKSVSPESEQEECE